ncbi:hypothetical protein GCM10020000_18200 [Streptomyces olivoverticillatus]
MPVEPVAVAARGVGLPQLHQLAPHRPPAPVQDPPADRDPLAQRLPAVLPGQIGVGRAHIGRPEDRSGQLDGPRGEGERHGRLLGSACDAADVGRGEGPLPGGQGPGGRAVCRLVPRLL